MKWKSWIRERFPLEDISSWILHKEILGGARFSYTLGSAALFLFILLVLTGVWQMFIYVPDVEQAYDSLAYLRLDVPFGWLVHGLHYWGANAFSFVVGLHILRTFIWGAYKRPRELIWLTGIVLLLLTIGFMFTGPILPWDKKGYWACKVGMDMLGDIPVVGNFLQTLVQGTPVMGELTLDRMFACHVALFPMVALGVIIVHLISFRFAGSAGPWKEEQRHVKGPFWPDQIFKDMLVATMIFFLLVALSVYAPPPFGGEADPLNTTYVPKPEWTFLFIYQFLKYFPGGWEPIGIVMIPLLIICLLVSLPFLDKNPQRNPAKRAFVMACGGIFVTLVIVFAFIGYKSTPENVSMHTITPHSVEKKGEMPAPEPSAPPLAGGQKLFYAYGCNVCHTIDGKPSHLLGPDLILALSAHKHLTAEWLLVQLDSPKTHDPYSLMPSYAHLSAQDKHELIAFLEHLSTLSPAPTAPTSPSVPQKKVGFGQSINMIGSVSGGKALFDAYCIQCHGPSGHIHAPGFESVSGVPPLNPIAREFFSPDPHTFVERIDSPIQHGEMNPSTGPNMPAFGDTHSLSQPEIADLEAYVLALNGVDRAQIKNPGVAPKTFFYILLGLGGAFACFGCLYAWIKKK